MPTSIDKAFDQLLMTLTPMDRDLIRHKLAQERQLQARIASRHQREPTKEGAAELRSLLKILPDIVYQIDPNGHFTFLSDAVLALGYESGELIGEHFSKIIDPTEIERVSRSSVLEKYKGIVTGPENAPKLFDERRTGDRMTKWLEVKLRPKEGLEKHTEFVIGSVISVGEVVATGVYNESTPKDGPEFLGTVGIIRDITERRQMLEDKLRMEKELYQWQRLESIGQLAGGVAHDFNNMLGGISGFAEMIKRKFSPGNETLARYVDLILDSSRRASDLTNKLLAFARKGKYQTVTVDMHEIVEDVTSLLAHSIDRRIGITKHLHATSAAVMGDPAQLHNAILNMAINARDAMPEGGEISFVSDITRIDEAYIEHHPDKLQEGIYLRIAVGDTGMGMDESTKERIFEPFFTTKGLGKGTGLGLASVYGTAKAHAGSVEVYSELGKGTTFKLYLPLAEEAVAETSLADGGSGKGAGRILVVDDESIIREISATMLKDLGYVVDTCQDGQEAVRYYRDRARDIDLVLLDIVMPRMNGYDCFVEMKRINPKIKAIVMSGYAKSDEAEKMLAHGALSFVQKPFGIESLSTAVSSALKTETPDS